MHYPSTFCYAGPTSGYDLFHTSRQVVGPIKCSNESITCMIIGWFRTNVLNERIMRGLSYSRITLQTGGQETSKSNSASALTVATLTERHFEDGEVQCRWASKNFKIGYRISRVILAKGGAKSLRTTEDLASFRFDCRVYYIAPSYSHSLRKTRTVTSLALDSRSTLQPPSALCLTLLNAQISRQVMSTYSVFALTSGIKEALWIKSYVKNKNKIVQPEIESIEPVATFNSSFWPLPPPQRPCLRSTFDGRNTRTCL